MKHLKIVLISTLLLGHCLVAQTIKEKDSIIKQESLDEVVISVYRSHKTASEIPASVTIIPKDKVRGQIALGKSLKEAIAVLIPSLDFASQGRTNYAQNMRGRTALVLLDGVSLVSSRNVSRQFDAINPFNIEKIEVVSGANAIYGGGATGGIINIITKKSKFNEEINFETSLQTKSGFNKNDLDFEIGQAVKGGNNIFSSYLGVTYTKNQAMYDAEKNPVMIDFKQSDYQYNQGMDILGNLNFKISENEKINLTAQYYDQEVDNNKWVFLGKNFAGIKDPKLITIKDNADSDVTPKTQRFFTNLIYSNNNFWGNQRLTFQTFYRYANMAFGASITEAKGPAPTIPLTYSSYITKMNACGLKLFLSKKINDFDISYGLDYTQDNSEGRQVLFDPAKTFASGGMISKEMGTLDRYPDSEVTDLSAFTQINYKLNDFYISGGLRLQNTFVEIDDFRGFQEQVNALFGKQKIDYMEGGDNNKTDFLFNANLLYKANDFNQFYGRFSQGIEIPDPSKTYGFGTYTLNGNNYELVKSFDVSDNAIPSIKTNQFELGYRMLPFKGFSSNISAFYAISDKTINVDKQNFSISLKDNKIRNIGLELSAEYNAGFGGFIGANTLLMKTESYRLDEWKEQSALVINPNKISSYVGWKNKKVLVQAQMQHSFDYESDLDKTELEGFTLIDLFSNVKLPVGVLKFGIQNIFNGQYTTFWGQRSVMYYAKPLGSKKPVEYFGRGRTFSLGYSIEF